MSQHDSIQRRITASSIKAAVASAAVVATLGGWVAIGLSDARNDLPAAPASSGEPLVPARQQLVPARSEPRIPASQLPAQIILEPSRPHDGEHEGDEHEGDEHEGDEHEGDEHEGIPVAGQLAAPDAQAAPGQPAQLRAITSTRSSR